MGSQPTLDPARTRPPDIGQEQHRDTLNGRDELLEHLQTPAAFGGHEFGDSNPERNAVRDAEQTFDRLNPDFGVPADQRSLYGRQAVRDREAALSLGVRVAVHDSRQNDRNPVIWQVGQDYRAADAIQTARRDVAQARHGPERTASER